MTGKNVTERMPPEEDANLRTSPDTGTEFRRYELRAAPGSTRVRLDVFLARAVENASRTRAHLLIEAGAVRVNGRETRKPGRMVAPGDRVECDVPRSAPQDVTAEDIPLDIVYEDGDILIVNKPAGMVTHPAHGNFTGTLVNALLHYTGELSAERGIERAGILHRLDKGTSGLLCVAKTDAAHRFIARQFAAHTIEREYWAIAWGRFDRSTGAIEASVGRHRSDRKKMAVSPGGKHALTEYTVIEEFEAHSLVRLRLHTGRTHQIRVHLAHVRHPVLGDPTYGGRRIVYGRVSPEFKRHVEDLLHLLPRQALHARTLGFEHPRTRERVFFDSELPADMRDALAALRTYARS